jgi:hypothetical protein
MAETMEKWKTARTACYCALFAVISWCIKDALVAWSVVAATAATTVVSITVTIAVAAVPAYRYRSQVRKFLRLRHEQMKNLELRLDPNRESSGLAVDGTAQYDHIGP